MGKIVVKVGDAVDAEIIRTAYVAEAAEAAADKTEVGSASISASILDGTEMVYEHTMSKAAKTAATADARACAVALIEAARRDGLEVLTIRAIPADKPDSGYFQIIGGLLDPLVKHVRAATGSDDPGSAEGEQNDFADREAALPHTVEIICPDTAIADYHMMVYNYWYAATKGDRLMSEDWD